MRSNQTLKFGEWLPDLPALDNPGATIAENVIPHLDSYRQMRELAATSSALTAYCRGAAAYSDKDGNSEIYAGDATKLYRIASETWADKSGATYTTGAEDYWRFVKWGEAVIATNYADAIQTKAFGAGTNFAALGGSPPKARHIGTVRSFIVLGDLNDGTHYPSKIAWSGQNLETSWGSNPATQADSQLLAGDGGAVMAVTSGDIGVIVQERSIWEMRYEGPPTVFRFDETAPGIGTPAARSVVRYGATIFFLGNDGFYRYDIGKGPQRIGDKKVDNWFFDRADKELYYRMVGAIDIVNAKVVWSYSAGAGTPAELIIYDWTTGRWSYAMQEAELIFAGRSPGTTLEGLDSISASIDALEITLDSPQWAGGALALWGFDTAHKSGTFTGTPLTARLETTELASPDGSTIFTNGARSLVDGSGAVTLYAGSRDLLTNTYAYNAGVGQNAIGEHNFRLAARYMRFRTDITGGFDHAIGVRVAQKLSGVR